MHRRKTQRIRQVAFPGVILKKKCTIVEIQYIIKPWCSVFLMIAVCIPTKEIFPRAEIPWRGLACVVIILWGHRADIVLHDDVQLIIYSARVCAAMEPDLAGGWGTLHPPDHTGWPREQWHRERWGWMSLSHAQCRHLPTVSCHHSGDETHHFHGQTDPKPHISQHPGKWGQSGQSSNVMIRLIRVGVRTGLQVSGRAPLSESQDMNPLQTMTTLHMCSGLTSQGR